MKKLLIITQVVDKEDKVLGFFHRWILEFSKHCSKVTVICLKKGTYTLPSHVNVLSLGKEIRESRYMYIKNLYGYIIRERNNYDAVFIHMNQEYVLLGGLLWRFLGKKVLLWRNHPEGNILTRLAVFLSHKVYCTSENSFTNKFKKTEVMPVGIVTPLTIPNILRKPYSILSLGRISPVKNIETILSAFTHVLIENKEATLSIVGDPMPRRVDEEYFALLKRRASEVSVESLVFKQGVSPDKTVSLFLSHDVFVNATTPGSFDKTILEAMSVGTPSFVCQDIWKGTRFSHLSDHFYFTFRDESHLFSKIQSFFSLPDEKKDQLREEGKEFVREYHSLDALVENILSHI